MDLSGAKLYVYKDPLSPKGNTMYVSERISNLDRKVLKNLFLRMMKLKHQYLLKEWKTFNNKRTYSFYVKIDADPIKKAIKSKSRQREVNKFKKERLKKLLVIKKKKQEIQRKKKIELDKINLIKAEAKKRIKLLKREKQKEKTRRENEIKKQKLKQDRINSIGLTRWSQNQRAHINKIIKVKYRFYKYEWLVQDVRGVYWRLPVFHDDGTVLGAIKAKPIMGQLTFRNYPSRIFLSELEDLRYKSIEQLDTNQLLNQLKIKTKPL